MSDAWFSHRLAPDGDIEDGCHPDEAQALKDYFAEKTTVIQAAHAITKPIVLSSNPNNDLPQLWALLMDALIELPSQYTQPLIQLIQAIEELPKPDISNVEKDKLPVHGRLWRSLPGFGHQWADEGASYNWRLRLDQMEDISEIERNQLLERHVKRAKIEARLAVAGLADIPLDWGYECVADALERSEALLDFEVPAACQWLTVARDRFRADAGLGATSWALEKKRDLWKSQTDGKMTSERWQFWVNRLEALSNSNGVPANIRDIARKYISNLID